MSIYSRLLSMNSPINKFLKSKIITNVLLLTCISCFVVEIAMIAHSEFLRDYWMMAGNLLILLVICVFIFWISIIKKDFAVEINFKDVIEQLPGHVYWKNKDCVNLGSNTNNWKDFGLKSWSDYVDKTDHELFSKEEADKIRAADQEVMQTGRLKILEEEITNADGKKALYLSHKMPLRNTQKQIIGILGVSIDITHAKRETTDRLEMLENIIGLMPGHVYWLNKEGIYLGCNDNQAKSSGLSSRKEIIGKRNIDIPGFVIPEVLDPINEEVIKNGKTIIIEEPAVLQDGTQATFLSNKVPLHNSQKEIIGMVGISFNITDRKKTEYELKLAKEDAEVANQAKSAFLASMSHDLRTPLQAILIMTEVLQKRVRTSELQKPLNSISNASKELMQLVEGVLSFSKLESGKQELHLEPFDLRQLVEDVGDLMQLSANKKNLQLIVSYSDNISSCVINDPSIIRRILLNLLGNAVKFTEQGYVKLTVSAETLETDLSGLKFIIEDTGIGIPNDKLESIFERFSRVESGHKKHYEGIGLGLAIVKQLAQGLGGEIRVSSQLGHGSTFTCILPLQLQTVPSL
jgi:two-component system aerobic respiration control sensor histidine kinase ArcB